LSGQRNNTTEGREEKNTLASRTKGEVCCPFKFGGKRGETVGSESNLRQLSSGEKWPKDEMRPKGD